MVDQLQQQTTPASSLTSDFLGRLLFGLSVLALTLAPTQLTILVKGIPLAPAEPVLGLAILVWAIRWLRVRDSRSLPPLTHWLFVLAFALGVVAVSGMNQMIGIAKETVQMIVYLLIAVTIFRATLTTPRRLQIAVTALLVTTTFTVALSVTQRVLFERQNQPDPAL